MSLILLGLLAGAFTSCAVVPQVVQAYRTKQVRDLSIWQPLLLIVGLALWLAYGLLIDDTPLVVANLFSLACNLLLVGMKVVFGRKGEAV